MRSLAPRIANLKSRIGHSGQFLLGLAFAVCQKVVLARSSSAFNALILRTISLMDWYYSEGQERKGPVSDEEFQRLAEQGAITSQTLVWNESMPDWKPYSGPSSTPPLAMASVASSSIVVCAG